MVEILQREYYPTYTNGSTDWLISAVGDAITLRVRARMFKGTSSNQNNPINLSQQDDNTFIATNLNQDNWNELGVQVGDTINFRQKGSVTDTAGTAVDFDFVTNGLVQTIDGSELYCQGAIGDAKNIPGMIVTADGKQITYDSSAFYVVGRPEAVHFTYIQGTVDQPIGNSLNSFLDGSKLSFTADGLDTIPVNTPIDLIPFGDKSANNVLNAWVEYRGLDGTYAYRYHYDFYIKFSVVGLYENQLNLSTLFDQGNEIIPSWFNGGNTISDSVECKFLPINNNPNSFTKNDSSKAIKQGWVGWFGQRQNLLPHNMERKEVNYLAFDGTPINGIDINGLTTVTASISGVNNLSVNNTRYNLTIAYCPSDTTEIQTNGFTNGQNQYQNIDPPTGNIYTNEATSYLTLGVNNLTQFQGNAKFARFFTISNQSSQIDIDGDFECSFQIELNQDFKDYLLSKGEDDRNYIFAISVADHTLSTNDTDRVNVPIDGRNFVEYTPPPAPYADMEVSFLTHPHDDNAIGFDEPTVWVEDDLTARIKMWINPLLNYTVDSFEYGFEIVNTATGQLFSLDKTSLPVSNSITLVDGSQNFNFNQTRGFKLEQGNNKNYLKMNRETSMDDNRFGYLGFYGFKIRWEDWIEQTDTPPSVFFDNTLNNDGFNNDWYHYANQPDWQLHFVVYQYGTQNGNPVSYRNQFPITEVKDYEQSTELVGTFDLRKVSDNTDLSNGNDPITGRPLFIIPNDDDVLITIGYKLNSGVWDNDLSTRWATICLDEDGGAGQMIFRQRSSVWGSELDNPLIPEVGETHVKIEINPNDNTELLTTCVIDKDLLAQYPRFKISGRLGCLGAENDEIGQGGQFGQFNGQFGLQFN